MAVCINLLVFMAVVMSVSRSQPTGDQCDTDNCEETEVEILRGELRQQERVCTEWLLELNLYITSHVNTCIIQDVL